MLKPECMRDKTVVITGGFNYDDQFMIGWILVRKFALLGADVIFINSISDKSTNLIEDFRKKLEMFQKLKYISCNMNDFKSVQKISEKLDNMGINKIDLLIQNSDGLLTNKYKDKFEKDYDRFLKMNHLCNFYLSLQLQDKLRNSKEARILNFSEIPQNFIDKKCNNQTLSELDDKICSDKQKMSLFELSKLYNILITKGWGFYTKRKNAFNLKISEKFNIKSVCINPRTTKESWISFISKKMIFNKINSLKNVAESIEYKQKLLMTETIFFLSTIEFDELKDGSIYKHCEAQVETDATVSTGSALFFWNKNIETIKKYIPDLQYF